MEPQSQTEQLKLIDVTSDSPADIPCARTEHTSTLLLNSKRVVVYGGEKTSDFNWCDNDVFTYDIDNKKWKRIDISGERPRQRKWHAACSHGHDKLLVHGGEDAGVDLLSDFWELNLTDNTWTQLGKHLVAGETCPSKRRRHLMVQVEHKQKVVLGFGAYFDKGMKKLNDLWQLDALEPNMWLQIRCDWNPEGRQGMAVAIQQESIQLHGGEDKGQKQFADSQALAIGDDQKGIWSKLADNKYAGRCGHQADIIGKDIFIFTGGWGNQSTLLYHNQKQYHGADLKLEQHSTWSDGKQLCVFGGDKRTNDIQEIQLGKIFGGNPEALLLLDNFKYLLKVRQSCNKTSKYHKMKYHLLRYIQEQGKYFD